MSLISLLACMAFQHVDNDVVYGTVEEKKLMLDAYRPPTPNGRVFIAVHGGEYTSGAKGGETGEICRYLSKRGFTCFDIDYRLQKDVGGDVSRALKIAVDDTITAYHWVEKNATSYGGNPGRIAIGGVSSGAVIAMTTAYSKRIGARAVIDLWGGLFGEQSDIRHGDSPLLIVHGLNDKVISIGMARAIENRAKNVKVSVRFLLHRGGHGIALTKTIDHFTVLEHIDTFLRETIN